MPHLDGEACLLALRALDPDAKIVMTSGYSEQEVVAHFVGEASPGSSTSCTDDLSGRRRGAPVVQRVLRSGPMIGDGGSPESTDHRCRQKPAPTASWTW